MEDPLFRFLKKHWANVVFVLALAALAVYGFYKIRENTRLRNAEAADRFYRVSTLYSELGDARTALNTLSSEVVPEGKTPEETAKNKADAASKLEAKKKAVEDLRVRLTEALRSLSDDSAPYAQIASLYQGLLARDEGKAEEMKKFLLVEWKGLDPAAGERVFAELSVLAYARAGMSVPELKNEAKSILDELASKGTTAGVAAAVSLARIAENAEQAKRAKELLAAAQTRALRNKDLLDPELKQLETLLK